jgi:hypothetical protein
LHSKICLTKKITRSKNPLGFEPPSRLSSAVPAHLTSMPWVHMVKCWQINIYIFCFLISWLYWFLIPVVDTRHADALTVSILHVWPNLRLRIFCKEGYFFSPIYYVIMISIKIILNIIVSNTNPACPACLPACLPS